MYLTEEHNLQCLHQLMDFELCVTFEEKEEEKISVSLWTTQRRSQNTVASFTIKLFNLTGGGRGEMELILMSL